MDHDEKVKLEELRKKLFQEKIDRLESLGFKVTKTGDDGVTFFVQGRTTGTTMHMDRIRYDNGKAKELHLGEQEWNILDHVLFVLKEHAKEQHEVAVKAIAEAAKPRNHPRWENFYNLEKLPTRTLLNYLQKTRRYGGVYDPCYSGGGSTFRPISAEEIKAVLKTRPHIPNAKERAAAHTARNKMKKDRGGRGRR